MPLAGAKPKEQKVTRTPVVHDWVEVVEVPYDGPRPPVGRVGAATRQWWDAVTTLPHCARWGAGEWQYALATARIHHAFCKGDLARAQELRIRERAMGTTEDARRDLRIRYVSAEAVAAAENPGVVSDFEAERRRRLVEDAD